VGALPGRIISALRSAKVKNPVIVLDEIDKLGRGHWGSPEAALLEILDPEQNSTFTDHYLEVPFDLSEVMFITTANTLETLLPPLRDRLEIIELSGYTTEEKVAIARKHLIPKRTRRINLTSDDLELSDEVLRQVVQDYTREAGVRQLDRQIAKITRAIALDVARRTKDTPHEKTVIDVEQLRRVLGRPKHRQEVGERVALPGVATGLAWTPVGGDILFIEASRMRGAGKVATTGQLGEVMQESAQAALTYVRSHADELGIDADFLREQDIHIHVPAGGVAKDGPSAGITIFTALTSLLTGRRVRADTAMTGECSLRGRVLPVGGIRDKVAAARRAGLNRVILPRRNESDLEELKPDVRNTMEFILVDDMEEVLAAALEPASVPDERPLLTATGF
jgi:ATP-dependent Lon protease